MFHMEESACDLLRVLLDCSSLFVKNYAIVFDSLHPLNVLFNFSTVLNSNAQSVMILIIYFILEAGNFILSLNLTMV